MPMLRDVSGLLNEIEHAHRLFLLLVIAGRMCQPFAGIHCCLPCPKTDWLYPDNFNTITDAANWVNVASMVCTMFVLISWAVLPVEKTHRHYLSICLSLAVALLQVISPHPRLHLNRADLCRWGSSFLLVPSHSSVPTPLPPMTRLATEPVRSLAHLC
jgi:hypothetical protein